METKTLTLYRLKSEAGTDRPWRVADDITVSQFDAAPKIKWLRFTKATQDGPEYLLAAPESIDCIILKLDTTSN